MRGKYIKNKIITGNAMGVTPKVDRFLEAHESNECDIQFSYAGNGDVAVLITVYERIKEIDIESL